jgi:hypothetical protein
MRIVELEEILAGFDELSPLRRYASAPTSSADHCALATKVKMAYGAVLVFTDK